MFTYTIWLAAGILRLLANDSFVTHVNVNVKYECGLDGTTYDLYEATNPEPIPCPYLVRRICNNCYLHYYYYYYYYYYHYYF